MTTPQNNTALMAAAGVIVLLALGVAWVHNHPAAPQQPAAPQETSGTLEGHVVATTTP